MKFLRKKDYERRIDREILDELMDNNPAIIEAAEETAQAVFESYTSHRYDITELFKDLNVYDGAVTYAVGDLVLYPHEDGKIYNTLVASTGIVPEGNPTEFEAKDTRDKLALSLLLDISIFYAFPRVNSRQLQESKEQMYAIAMETLVRIGKGQQKPNWTERSDMDDVSVSYPVTFTTSQIKHNINY